MHMIPLWPHYLHPPPHVRCIAMLTYERTMRLRCSSAPLELTQLLRLSVDHGMSPRRNYPNIPLVLRPTESLPCLQFPRVGISLRIPSLVVRSTGMVPRFERRSNAGDVLRLKGCSRPGYEPPMAPFQQSPQRLVAKDVRDSLECSSYQPTTRFPVDANSKWCLSVVRLQNPLW